jgi:hypothetical protein
VAIAMPPTRRNTRIVECMRLTTRLVRINICNS